MSDFGQGIAKWLRLPNFYTRKDIPVDNIDIIKPNQLFQWKYLDKIKGELCGKKEVKIGLLIGVNCARALGGYTKQR